MGKKVGGRTYYYLVTSGRVDGGPRIVSQRYLGSAEQIDAATRGATSEPARTRHLAFGAVAAVWATLDRIGLARIVDEVVGGGRAKVSVGTYLALAVLHRAVGARTTARLAEWWPGTAADRFVRPKLDPEALSQRRFLRALDQLTEAHLERIDAAVFNVMTSQFGLGTEVLAVDLPHFGTFVNATGDGAPSTDASLVGLALAVTRAGAVPLLSHVYPRSRQGSVAFGELMDRLVTRHRQLVGEGAVTVVFDAGQYAQFEVVAEPGRHFVGALPGGDHPDLLSLPAATLRPLRPGRFHAVSAVESRANVFRANRRVVLVRSATLRAAQARGFTQAVSDASRRLDGLAASLAAGRFRESREKVLAEIARITRFRFGDRVLSTTLTGSRPGEFRLAYHVDEAAARRLDDDVFGRQLLVTDHEDWSVPEVITAYRARYHLESTFRVFDDPYVSAFSEAWKWNDRRIAVHARIRVLAATITHLMRHQAHQAGIDLSVRELLDQLAGIEETQLTYPSTGGRPRVRRHLTERDATRQRLFDLFGLADLAPHPA